MSRLIEMTTVLPGQRYRSYKGEICTVLGVARMCQLTIFRQLAPFVTARSADSQSPCLEIEIRQLDLDAKRGNALHYCHSSNTRPIVVYFCHDRIWWRSIDEFLEIIKDNGEYRYRFQLVPD